MPRTRILALLLALSAPCASATAAELKVAVAANFTGALERLAEAFERTTGHKLVISSASTGKLYAQISNGAPFDVFLAADDEHPRRLTTAGLAVPESQFTYAIGRLVLWSAQPGVVDDRGAVLSSGKFAKLALANPKTAPYGAAAEQALRRLGIWDQVARRLVYGENIAQTFQFVYSGNAELGFVALAQLHTPSNVGGSHWIVPEQLHEPLRQDAVLLQSGATNPAARAFLVFLQSAAARTLIAQYGYDTPD